MGLNKPAQTGVDNTDVTIWRRKTLDLLYYVATICATVEIGFLVLYYNQKPEYATNLLPYLSAFIAILILTFIKKIPYNVRAIGLSAITFCYGCLDLYSTGLTGDGRIFLIVAPVIALLLTGPRSCEIITILSLLVFAFASYSPFLDFLPLQFIPQEAVFDNFTWISSGVIFGTVMIGLVTVVWQFARINTQTSQQNNRLASEGKALRQMATNLQLREAEMQALLNAIGDKVLVIDQQGRIVHSADGSASQSNTIAEGHSKNILRILPQPQAADVLAQIQEVLYSGQTRVIDYSLSENGRERWYSGTISPFEDDKVVMVSRDISESINSNSREREQRKFANALKSTASIVNSSLEINEVLTRIIAAVGEVVPIDAATIILVGERGKLNCVGRSDIPGFLKNFDRMNQLTINDVQTLRTIKRTGKPLFIPDVTLYPAWTNLADENPTRSFLGCPIKIKGKVEGFLTLDSMQPGFYTQDHVDRLQSFVDLAGTAIENANLQRETQKMAISDELTGLFNRRGLMDLGRREVDRAKRFHHPLSVAIMDMDNFKSINDTYGHVAGDQLLNQIADCCRASFREIDIIGRYGGDEIVVILIENDSEQAFQIADRFRQSIASRVFRTEGGNLSTTVSIGIAELTPQIENLTQLIDQADRALYLAKEGGRNRIMAV
jgi:diguanylate cyclase (GGDEF)-like protein